MPVLMPAARRPRSSRRATASERIEINSKDGIWSRTTAATRARSRARFPSRHPRGRTIGRGSDTNQFRRRSRHPNRALHGPHHRATGTAASTTGALVSNTKSRSSPDAVNKFLDVRGAAPCRAAISAYLRRATRLRGISTSQPRRRRDSSKKYPRGASARRRAPATETARWSAARGAATAC